MTTAQQVERAWRLLADGAAMDDLRASWDGLVAIRHELDEAVVSLASRIEQLRREVAAEKQDNDEEATT